jgi:galactokinase
VRALRDLALSEFDTHSGGLDPIVRCRARHVLTENQRTLHAATALAAGDMRRVGRLMAQSHDSMRDDFQITVPAVDQLVHVLQHAIGDAGGARMTGGGFGGCVVALLPEALLHRARDAVARHYRAPSGEPADVHVCRASNGVGELE